MYHICIVYITSIYIYYVYILHASCEREQRYDYVSMNRIRYIYIYIYTICLHEYTYIFLSSALQLPLQRLKERYLLGMVFLALGGADVTPPARSAYIYMYGCIYIHILYVYRIYIWI